MNEKEYMKLWGRHCVLLRKYNESGQHIHIYFRLNCACVEVLTLAAFNPGSPDPDYEQKNNCD